MPNLQFLSYCGLYCGTCFLLHDQVADQALALLAKFKEIEFEKWGKGLAAMSDEMKAFEHTAECCRVLAAWDGMRCHKTCREGGGSAGCEIRTCCQNKKLTGCWECQECFTCDRLEKLKQVNGEMHINHIREIHELGIEAFIQSKQDQPPAHFHS